MKIKLLVLLAGLSTATQAANLNVNLGLAYGKADDHKITSVISSIGLHENFAIEARFGMGDTKKESGSLASNTYYRNSSIDFTGSLLLKGILPLNPHTKLVAYAGTSLVNRKYDLIRSRGLTCNYCEVATRSNTYGVGIEMNVWQDYTLAVDSIQFAKSDNLEDIHGWNVSLSKRF